jgi:metallo-beta-lactamase class B
MRRRLTIREAFIVAIAPLAVVALLVFPKWLNELRPVSKVGGQAPAEPFRIAANFYFVGASDLSIFLLTGPAGHVVIDAGYPTTARMVMDSIAKLGVDVTDVKVLLNSAPSVDLAGGLAVLQQSTGAELWTSEASAPVIASGGYMPDAPLPLRALIRSGLLMYPPPRIDHRFRDGDTIRVGPLALTAHSTAGAGRDCTTWTFQVHDGDRTLNVVSACGLGKTLGFRYPGQDEDIERSLRVLRGLPADIWVTSHGRAWGRYRKYVASTAAKNPVDSFIDPEGYRDFLDKAEDEFRRGVMH